MIFNKLKVLFHFFKKKKPNKQAIQTFSEDDLYSLDGRQLKNLLDKNIYFDFFQLDSLTEEIALKLKKYLQKAQLKTKEEVLFQLKEEKDFKKPIVLICERGESSKIFSRKVRTQGFTNVYFIKKGFQSLMEDF